MTSLNIRKLAVLATVAGGLAFTGQASAAAPDGFGVWADGIAVTNQGMRKNGTPVLPDRSDPLASLGVAEGTQDLGTFYSLGMGGSTTYAFQNGISEGTFVVESTWTDFYYPTETAKVEISTNGITYQEIGNITKEDAEVEVPDGFGCALFVRVTDTSNAALFEATADGFDVDGVRSMGETCATAGEVPNSCTELSRQKSDRIDKATAQFLSRKAERKAKVEANKSMSRKADKRN